MNPQGSYAASPSPATQQPEVSTYRGGSVRQLVLHHPQGQASSTPEGQIYQGPGMFYGANNFTIQGSTFADNTTDGFMEKLLSLTIIGAEYDSSDRDPPPRCHPGTRLAIIERCKVFIAQCNGKEKMCWVVGPAGVGKTAIMQIVAEETPADASVFFSVNGRHDGTKTIITIAYQLAAKYEPYRQFISREINRDPSLLRKALSVQFQKFIVDPFIRLHLFNPSHRFVVIIDGLDECDNPLTQRDLLGLISDFCLLHPKSPLVWFIASRPEPHIASFFDDDRVLAAYTMEEISIDSDEACEDVQQYLRAEFKNIKAAFPNLRRRREWPSELDFTKIATAADGLFAYASTVLRYINDPHYGDPVSQLGDLLVAIELGSADGILRSNNPLALLDALYDRIISKIPDGVMANTRKLLVVHSEYTDWPRDNFRQQCNRLGLTENAAYGALRHLHAVVKVPPPDKADDEGLSYFHKSFEDFLFDSKRSKFSRNISREARLLKAQASFRILEQVPDNFGDVVCGDGIECYDYGCLKDSPGFCDNVSLSWPGDEFLQTKDHELRLKLYRDSMSDLCARFSLWDEYAWNVSGFYALTTRFATLGPRFPLRWVRDFVFDQLRSELMSVGKLKQVPLRTLDYAAICGSIDLQFMSPVGTDVKYSDPWNPVCKHTTFEEEDVGGSKQRRGGSTLFVRVLDDRGDDVAHTDTPRLNIKGGKDSHWVATRYVGAFECRDCWRRFARQFVTDPDQLVTVFVDSTEICYVEWSFVDPEDGVSEWRYRFCHSGAPSCVD